MPLQITVEGHCQLMLMSWFTTELWPDAHTDKIFYCALRDIFSNVVSIWETLSIWILLCNVILLQTLRLVPSFQAFDVNNKFEHNNIFVIKVSYEKRHSSDIYPAPPNVTLVTFSPQSGGSSVKPGQFSSIIMRLNDTKHESGFSCNMQRYFDPLTTAINKPASQAHRGTFF